MDYITRVKFYMLSIIVLITAFAVTDTIRRTGRSHAPNWADVAEAGTIFSNAQQVALVSDATEYTVETADLPQESPPAVEQNPVQEVTAAQENTNLGLFTAFAYCLCIICTEEWSHEHPVNQDDPHFTQRTASGTVPTPGRTIAVDINIIPLGTHVYVQGLGWRIAEDRGGAIRGNTLDILKSDHDAALRWGVRQVEVYIRGE